MNNNEKEEINMYTNFEELHKAYGFDKGNKTRNDLNCEEERAFVKDCFDTYEYIGFAKTFGFPYAENANLIGKKFTVLSRVKELLEDKDGVDLECLPMWNIRLEDGTEMPAYPEEICLAERKSKGDMI